MAKPPTTTTLVGLNSSIRPCPEIHAVMLVARLTPAKSANAASNGIAGTARDQECRGHV
jgi:hypothetical protein